MANEETTTGTTEEIEALRKMIEALQEIDPKSRKRALIYAIDYFGLIGEVATALEDRRYEN